MYLEEMSFHGLFSQKQQTMQQNCNRQGGLSVIFRKVWQFCPFWLYRYTPFFSGHLTYYPFKLCGRHYHLKKKSYQLQINAVFRYLASDCSVINVAC